MPKRYAFIVKIFLCIIAIFSCISISYAADSRRVSVKSDVANVRSGPGTKYGTLWKVQKYHPLRVIGKTGKWYHFKDFEGDKGWIHTSLVISGVPSVIVKKNDCNIRSGPGTGFRIVIKAGKGVVFRVLKRKGKWIHVRHADGDQGWIYNSLVW